MAGSRMKRKRMFGVVRDEHGRGAPVTSKTVADAIEGLQDENRHLREYLQSAKRENLAQTKQLARYEAEIADLKATRWYKFVKHFFGTEASDGKREKPQRSDLPQALPGAATPDAAEPA